MDSKSNQNSTQKIDMDKQREIMNLQSQIELIKNNQPEIESFIENLL